MPPVKLAPSSVSSKPPPPPPRQLFPGALPPLCRFHEERLGQVEAGVRAANVKLDRIVEKIVPEQNTLAITTKWGSVRGGAPWIIALSLVIGVLLALKWGLL